MVSIWIIWIFCLSGWYPHFKNPFSYFFVFLCSWVYFHYMLFWCLFVDRCCLLLLLFIFTYFSYLLYVCFSFLSFVCEFCSYCVLIAAMLCLCFCWVLICDFVWMSVFIYIKVCLHFCECPNIFKNKK